MLILDREGDHLILVNLLDGDERLTCPSISISMTEMKVATVKHKSRAFGPRIPVCKLSAPNLTGVLLHPSGVTLRQVRASEGHPVMVRNIVPADELFYPFATVIKSTIASDVIRTDHLSLVLWILFATLLRSDLILAKQVPLNVVGDPGTGLANNLFDSDPTRWNFEDLPIPNATGHLVFETVHSLLQHWPNTRMRNGHTIVPGTVPIGTYLYHATNRHYVPTIPDWVSMNPEGSTYFCMGPPEIGCWHLTLVTTRPLKCCELYSGTMDTQDVLTWGKVLPNKTSLEQERISTLCEWGSRFGVDGFIRMEMDLYSSEAMICDFASGLEVVSFLQLASMDPISVPPVRESRMGLRAFESVHAGSWSDRFPGEPRVQLDLANMISFYDTDLVPSLVAVRLGKERWDHRVLNISDEDSLRAKIRVEEGLTRPRELSSR
ncbi:hypothetical protein EDC04DRAFT_2611669, partial [Pisolithus marmoratus]